MATRSKVMVFSVAAHLAIGVALGTIDAQSRRAATAIELAESVKKRAETKVEEKPEPQKPEPQKRPAARRAAPAAAPEPAPAAPPTSLDALPDFGFSLSGGVEGGVALPTAAPAVAAAVPTAAAAPTAVKRVAKPAAVAADPCEEPPAKPRPKSIPQPSYTAAALQAGIEGKVRIQITVDETGRVTDVRVLAGLGHGLDEAALAAARQAVFEPAVRCGKPVSATFTVSMRFTKP